MNVLLCHVVRTAILLALLAVVPVPAVAQTEDPAGRLAQEAAEQWAKRLINSLYFRDELPSEARKRLALQPLNPLHFGLSDRHRWQLYGWMLGGLERADPRYRVVDRARITDSYHAMEEAAVENLEARYLEILKTTATRINVVCQGNSRGQWIVLDCSAKDIETGHVLGRAEASFNVDWFPLVRLDYALGAVAGRIVSRLSRPGVVEEIRVNDQVRGNDPGLVEYVVRSLRSVMARQMRRRGWSSLGAEVEMGRYKLEATLVPFDKRRLVLDVMVYASGNKFPLDSVSEDVALDSLPAPPDAAPAPKPEGSVSDPSAVELPDGFTLADWVLLAEDRLSRGDHARLLTEANRHIRNHGDVAAVVEVRERAVSGLVDAVRVETRDDAPEALKRIARIEAAVGAQPALLRLRAQAHRLLGDYAAVEAAHVAWLRAAPQDHPRRREVLSQLARVREWRPQHDRFAELLGRPFSRDTAEGGVGWSDLHYAALLDMPGVVGALLDAGMAVDTRLKEDGVPFGDDLKRKLAALGHGEKFGGWQADGETPLMIAAIANVHQAFEYLIERGANIQAKSSKGWTPLHHAASGDAVKAAEHLVAQGADVHAKDNGGRTPLHDAAWANAVKVVAYLAGQGADIHAKDDHGETPLHDAARRDAVKAAEYLVAQGTDVHAKDNYGETPLHDAARRDAVKAAEYLVAQGADIHAKDNNGMTPLHHAGWGDAVKVAEYLAGRGADVRAKDNHGETPLAVAEARGSENVVKLLARPPAVP